MGSGIARLLAAAVCAASIDAQAIATQWTVVDLTPGSIGIANGISPNGTVVGCTVAGSQTQAFAYANGQMRMLPAPAGSASCALVVNDNGVIAGRIDGEITIWDGTGAHGLGVKGNVTGIDESGAIVGGMEDGTTNANGGKNTRAFLWSNGVFTDLGAPSGWAYAIGINHGRQVAVFANGELFMYQNGVLRDLGASVFSGSGFNDRGEIVGATRFGQAGQDAYIYDGTVHQIAGAVVDGGAVAINNLGQVLVSGEGTYGGIVDGGQQYSLDKLAAMAGGSATTTWHHMEGKAINDRGWIVGQGGSSDFHAFLLMPKDSSTPRSASNPVTRASVHTTALIRSRAP